MDDDKKKFKEWFEKILKLPQYYDVFLANGIDTLEIVQLVTMNELKQLNITLIGHTMKILKEIAKLKQNSMNNNDNYIAQEGNILIDTNR